MKREKSRMNPVVLDWNWRFGCELIALSSKRAWEQGHPVTMNTLSSQIMVSKYHSLRLPWWSSG